MGGGAGGAPSAEPTSLALLQRLTSTFEQEGDTVMFPFLEDLFGHGVRVNLDQMGLEKGKPARESAHRTA